MRPRGLTVRNENRMNREPGSWRRVFGRCVRSRCPVHLGPSSLFHSLLIAPLFGRTGSGRRTGPGLVFGSVSPGQLVRSSRVNIYFWSLMNQWKHGQATGPHLAIPSSEAVRPAGGSRLVLAPTHRPNSDFILVVQLTLSALLG